MTPLTSAVLAASTVQAIGTVIALVAMVGFVVYALFNVRAGREEVGSELELAANLKPYLDDDELETKKLDRTLTMGLATLAIVGIGLPAYWLAEPGRQQGAIEEFGRVFETRGEELYTEGAQCNACHGPEGVGGAASYTILDDENEFVAQVDWIAPALDTVLLRYDRSEVAFVLNYGRPFSPMPAWGAPGGGPLTEQQIDNIIDYLESIQISSDESKEAVESELRSALELAEGDDIDYESLETGEALFNLGQDSGFAGGAYACGRCHTRGWSIEADTAAPETADLVDYIEYPDGSGAFGPSLRSGIIPRQFATIEELAEFLHVGTVDGEVYGQNGLGKQGQMPGFGDNPNTEDDSEDGMFTAEMIASVARYVESLGDDSSAADNEPTQSAERGLTEGEARNATDLDDEG
ncbi:MAG: c-type cytochrome [Acidimicrobiales bacterium]